MSCSDRHMTLNTHAEKPSYLRPLIQNCKCGSMLTLFFIRDIHDLLLKCICFEIFDNFFYWLI